MKYMNNGYFMPEFGSKSKRYHNRYMEKKDLQELQELEGKTDFFVGAALSITHSKDEEIYRKKVEAGSQFFMTQLTYDSRKIIDFMEKVNPALPIFVGSGPITSAKRMIFFREQLKIPGISDKVIKRLKASKNMGLESVEICTEMYHEIRDFAKTNNYTVGAHVMSIRSPDLAYKIIEGI
jgi:5,10-methylenetetrahydrofolate reductase